MQKAIENSISMFKTVKAVCGENIATIDANVGVKNTYEQFLSLLASSEIFTQEQTLNRKGITKDKKNVREQLALTLEAAAGIIKAHADSVNNQELFSSVHLNMSKLRFMRDQAIIAHGQNVVKALTDHQAELTAFAVDSGYIAGVEKMLEAYIIHVAKPTAARNSKKAATLQLKEKVRVISSFLRNELDNAMLVFKQSNSTFHLTYRNARRIVNNGVRHHTTVTPITSAA